METLLFILGLLVFLTAITISVALHEGGHLLAAKKLGVSVPRYFVGFGPTLWSKQIGDTEYGVKALPLGGFVQVEDESQPEDAPERQLLSYIAPWKRFIIFLAGPMVNIVLGVVILFALLVSTPMMVGSNLVGDVPTCSDTQTACAAQAAGIKAGDRIVEMDGHTITKSEDLIGHFKNEGSTIVVEREGQRLTFQNVKPNEQGRIGVSMKLEAQDRSAIQAASTIGTVFTLNIDAIAALPSQIPGVVDAILRRQQRDPNSISSIVGVGRVYGETTTADASTSDKMNMWVMYTGLVNIGLGLANLLPMMPLDGGRIFVVFLDLLKTGWRRVRHQSYEPVSYKWVSAMTIVSGILVFGVSALLLVADLVAPVHLG